MASNSLSGSCACGAIKYSIPEAPEMAHACHCTTCQKVSGGVFLSVKGGKNPEISGQDNLTVWRSSDWAERAFCKTCGSSVYYKLTMDAAGSPHAGDYYFCAGGLEDWKGLKVNHEMYIDRKPKAYSFVPTEGHKTDTKAQMEAAFAN